MGNVIGYASTRRARLINSTPQGGGTPFQMAQVSKFIDFLKKTKGKPAIVPVWHCNVSVCSNAVQPGALLLCWLDCMY